MSYSRMFQKGAQLDSLSHVQHGFLPLLFDWVAAIPANSRNQFRFFHHNRKSRPPATKMYPPIVYKKKDSPEVYPSLVERLRELDPVLRDPECHKKVNIGFSRLETEKTSFKRRRQRAVLHDVKNDAKLIKLSHDRKLSVDVDAVQSEWLLDDGPSDISRLAQHDGIFNDLFGPYAYFQPLVPLTVEYDFNETDVTPVYRGNIIKPSEARNVPHVEYTSPSDAIWTLLLTGPDGDLYKPNSECLHWMVTNIKGSDLTTGDVVVPYLPPVPPRGTGYQRLVFVLYRHTGGAVKEHDQYQVQDPFDLRQRSFSTEQFYRQQEEVLTPVGLCWYFSDWDTSLTKYYHQVLGMKEPVFEYEFPKPYIAPQTGFPLRRNFTDYLDRHRGPHQISEEMLLRRLRRLNPFRREVTRLPYSSAVPINRHMPSWQRQEIQKERCGIGKYRELYRQDYDVDVMGDEETLREASQLEVEKNHIPRMGVDWAKTYIGLRKRKVIQEEKDAEERAEREAQYDRIIAERQS